ncbi:hypothetical protein F8388_008707 [Cannabis sativa]|uniref:DUF4283 domain-containing protein n=1 Tax=Cannabis sativa TaxID=3483 RepID=A0A7J6HLU3_CANSA|nr:hypothetical protein F8388_008707 [Cannabis sativa]
MAAVVLSFSREGAMIIPIAYGICRDLLQGWIQHLHFDFSDKLFASRYISIFSYLRIWILRRSLLLFLDFACLVSSHTPSLSLPNFMDSLALNMSQILNLTEKEVVVHDLTDDDGRDNQPRRSFCLVFRVLITSHSIKPEWFEDAMKNSWITRAPLTFSDYGSGMFMVEFACECDMRRVLEGQPWHFDHCLVTCANPQSLDTLLPNQLCCSPF